MPYIQSSMREVIDKGQAPLTVGELNYVITQTLIKFIEGNHSYSSFNAIIGVLECAKLELYRRMISHYEDEKCKINGDVYGMP